MTPITMWAIGLIAGLIIGYITRDMKGKLKETDYKESRPVTRRELTRILKNANLNVFWYSFYDEDVFIRDNEKVSLTEKDGRELLNTQEILLEYLGLKIEEGKRIVPLKPSKTPLIQQ